MTSEFMEPKGRHKFVVGIPPSANFTKRPKTKIKDLFECDSYINKPAQSVKLVLGSIRTYPDASSGCAH